jgi:uncharacterized protein YndB with AHSA1/START domain
MEITMAKKKSVSIEVYINAPINLVWDVWNNPKYVVQWNHASDDWHSPSATNQFYVKGKFVYRMEAKDGSFSFDFSGTYMEIQEYKLVVTKLDDDRMVRVEFIELVDSVKVIEEFEIEDENSIELQRQGWLSILNNFKQYTEQIREIDWVK